MVRNSAVEVEAGVRTMSEVVAVVEARMTTEEGGAEARTRWGEEGEAVRRPLRRCRWPRRN